jgi:hypothetical protein
MPALQQKHTVLSLCNDGGASVGGGKRQEPHPTDDGQGELKIHTPNAYHVGGYSGGLLKG